MLLSDSRSIAEPVAGIRALILRELEIQRLLMGASIVSPHGCWWGCLLGFNSKQHKPTEAQWCYDGLVT